MSTVHIIQANVVGPDGLLPNHTVRVDDGRIALVERSVPQQPGRGEEVIDGSGGFLVPGFIDLHIHGTHDFLVDNGAADLEELCRLLPRYGVTGFLPTVVPRPKVEHERLAADLASVRSQGTEILGFHFEGPFLTLSGALSLKGLGPADASWVDSLIEGARPHRAVFSIAPDFERIVELIPRMSMGGANPVFMTHTAASVEQTQAAIEAGACHATHFYDVFPCPPVSEPGVRPCGAVEAVLADPRVSVDFILDGEHVDPVAVRMALACKGPEGVCLITDANIGAGLPPGRRHRFGNYDVVMAYPGGPGRMADDGPIPGALSGSGLTMDAALRNAVRLAAVDLVQAVRMASFNPARVLRLERKKGRIAAGYDADLVLLDEKLTVVKTWVSGRLCYDREAKVGLVTGSIPAGVMQERR